MHRAVIAAALLAAACTDLAREPWFDPRDAAPATDAAPDDAALVSDAGCAIQGNLIGRAIPIDLLPAGDAGAVVSAVVFNSNTVVAMKPEYLRVEIYTVGRPDDLRGVVVPLGAGNNAEWSTCTHCMLVYRHCSRAGELCDPNPYFPRAGRAVVVEGAGVDGGPFEVDLTRVLLRPVTFDGTRVTPVASDECILFEPIVVAGPLATPSACQEQECAIAATADTRHVTP
jgi:hypothetical protein